MKSQWKRRTVGLLGICAVAALMATAVFATSETASAQSNASVTAVYGGWADDDFTDIASVPDLDQLMTSEEAPASVWDCADLRCHYVNLTWSGIGPIQDLEKAHESGLINADGWTISVARVEVPDPEDVSLAPGETVITSISQPVSVAEAGEGESQSYTLGVPWAGERVRILVQGSGTFASDIVRIPDGLPDAFKLRSDKSAVTLVDHNDDQDLKVVLLVFEKTPGATGYEVQYIFRNGLHRADQGKYTRVYRAVTTSQKAGLYERLNGNFDHHRHAGLLNGLTNSDFDDDGANWIFVTTPLPKLLEGAEGWPEVISDEAPASEITDHLDENRNSIGVRVSPVLACGDTSGGDPHDVSELCSVDSERIYPLILKGRSSSVSYLTFQISDLVRESSSE